MSHPDDERLAALALAEPGLDPQVAEHVLGCARCRAGVDALARAAGLLRGVEAEPFLDPPPAVWDAVRAELDARPLAAVPSPGASAGVTAGASAGVPQRRRRPLAWVGAVAAGLVLGLLAGRTMWGGAADPGVSGTVVASARLDTLDTKNEWGAARVIRTASGLELTVGTQPLARHDGYLEVWLINTDLKRMVSIGVMGRDTGGTFTIDPALLDKGYTIVDISREPFDDRPQHSGDSLVRGTLA